jgi:hypothetical protein
MVSPKPLARIVGIPHDDESGCDRKHQLCSPAFRSATPTGEISAKQCVESTEKLAQQGRAFLLFNDSIPDHQADELVQNLPYFHDFR